MHVRMDRARMPGYSIGKRNAMAGKRRRVQLVQYSGTVRARVLDDSRGCRYDGESPGGQTTLE